MTAADQLKLANDSGFPLQIAVQREIEHTRSSQQWNVRFVEHSWSNPLDVRSGFIDLVVSNQARVLHLVIECKRVRDTNWLFLESSGRADPVKRAKCWVSSFQGDEWVRVGWYDVDVTPRSPEALFCAVRGQKTGDGVTLLEKTAAEVVSATEALATEIRNYRHDFPSNFQMFFNVIVTTADLMVARFEPTKMSITDGTLESLQCERVPFVRLRKQLSTRRRVFGVDDFKSGTDLANEKENTVFVVRADALTQFLDLFNVSDDSLRPLFASR